MTQVVKYTMKVKVIKYFLQIFVIWNNGAGKKWGARYTFWYIVLLTLCNGDRRIVHWPSLNRVLRCKLVGRDCEHAADAPYTDHWLVLGSSGGHSRCPSWSCWSSWSKRKARWATIDKRHKYNHNIKVHLSTTNSAWNRMTYRFMFCILSTRRTLCGSRRCCSLLSVEDF